MIGGLLIDKPEGWTSHDVVGRVRRLAGTRRVGHTGTLDPFATGVLVVCLGAATRLSRFLTGCDKEYLATMRLGWATDTQDLRRFVVDHLTTHPAVAHAETSLVYEHTRGPGVFGAVDAG